MVRLRNQNVKQAQLRGHERDQDALSIVNPKCCRNHRYTPLLGACARATTSTRFERPVKSHLDGSRTCRIPACTEAEPIGGRSRVLRKAVQPRNCIGVPFLLANEGNPFNFSLIHRESW
jgi:hypothetical protein